MLHGLADYYDYNFGKIISRL